LEAPIVTLTLASPEAITDKAGTEELEAPELALIFPSFEARSDISGTGDSTLLAITVSSKLMQKYQSYQENKQ
jgi:hypothetical protein